MLYRISSLELAKWMAFERAYGPIGMDYTNEVLAAIHEQLQTVVFVTGASQGNTNMPKPQKFPRPSQVAELIDMERPHTSDDGQPVGGAADLNAYFDSLES